MTVICCCSGALMSNRFPSPEFLCAELDPSERHGLPPVMSSDEASTEMTSLGKLLWEHVFDHFLKEPIWMKNGRLCVWNVCRLPQSCARDGRISGGKMFSFLSVSYQRSRRCWFVPSRGICGVIWNASCSLKCWCTSSHMWPSSTSVPSSSFSPIVTAP